LVWGLATLHYTSVSVPLGLSVGLATLRSPAALNLLRSVPLGLGVGPRYTTLHFGLRSARP